jgi:hypothetical protein
MQGLCSLQHAQLYGTRGRVLYAVLYIRIIQTFYTHSSIIMLHVLLAVPCYHTNKMVAIFCCWYLMYRAILYCAVVHAGILHVTTSLPFEQNSC